MLWSVHAQGPLDLPSFFLVEAVGLKAFVADRAADWRLNMSVHSVSLAAVELAGLGLI